MRGQKCAQGQPLVVKPLSLVSGAITGVPVVVFRARVLPGCIGGRVVRHWHRSVNAYVCRRQDQWRQRSGLDRRALLLAFVQVQGGRRARVCACPYSSLVPRALLQICGFDPLDKNFYMSFDEANSLKKIDQNQ